MRFRDTLLRGASLWSMISALDKQEPFVSDRRAIVVVKHYRTIALRNHSRRLLYLHIPNLGDSMFLPS